MGWEGWPVIGAIVTLIKTLLEFLGFRRPKPSQTSIEAGTVFTGPVSIHGPVIMVAPTNWTDGLPQAPPKIRDPFEEGQKLEKEYKYRDAIKHYEACFQPETTASHRAALHILIGN